MRKVIAVLGVIAVVAGTLGLAVALATAGPFGCATALLQGTLVELDGKVAVASVPRATSRVSSGRSATG